MRRKYVLMLLFFVALLLICGCSQKSAQRPNGKYTIATTFFPLYDITGKIAGEKAEVFSIVPAGAEPHDYEVSPYDLQRVAESKAFVVLGVEFTQFEDKLVQAAGGNLEVIPAAKDVPLLDSTDNVKDPHIWLSPNNVKVMVRNINEGLKKADPKNADYYEQNAKKVIENLTMLDSKFKLALSNCNKKLILVTHNAYSYIGKDYGFKTIYISGLDPESEPTPKQIKALVDASKQNNIKYVFYEELVDPKIARTIASEVGAQTLELNPLEGSKNPSEDYFSMMRKNLINLKIAMECK